MNYVLVLITVFTSSDGLHSQTRFQQFENRAACEQAASGIRDGMANLKGTLGRSVIAQCHGLK